MRNWLDRYHGKCSRALLAAPSEGLPCLDLTGLRLYEAQLLEEASTDPDYTYMQLRAWLEQTHGVTCSKNTMRHWFQSPFQTKEMVSLEQLISGYVPRTRLDGPGVRSTCIFCPCKDPDYEVALISENTYASNTEKLAAFMEGDTSIRAVIQKVRHAGMREDLTPEDYEEARSYAEAAGFCAPPAPWLEQV